jgi:flagellar basal-body rod modification protein FlgD
MALSPVTDATSIADTASSTDAKAQKAVLEKDAFLKLLVAQLQHQDPLAPTEGTEFVAQLSQFAMVEQAIAQSAKLDVISAQLTGLASNEATSLVGKVVTVRVDAQTKDGAPVGVSQDSGGKVVKVTFDKGYPELHLDSGVTAPISDLVSVGGDIR